ncbi:hypothetical protein BC936DRAFT_150097 [Jimgerdemannia flammicorona]|uniref:Uncharacterized protein n=1 Tax=Jimgerdemannia flammicorona TaxID=994334 RepID=A0A433DJU3_9FUNG|nr:hypothetical protein BC936DRAFT_150097 [Jimgerdemannia flammicorona]
MSEKLEEHIYQTSLNDDVRKEKINFSSQQLESRNSKRNRHGTENGANDEDDFDSKRRMVNQNGYSLRNRKNVDYFEDLSSEDPIEEGIEDNIEAAISETSSLDIEDLENSKHTGKEEERWNEMKEITAVDDAMSISICLPQEEDADVEKASESAKEANEQESLQLKIGTSGPHVLRQARRMLFTFAAPNISTLSAAVLVFLARSICQGTSMHPYKSAFVDATRASSNTRRIS